MRMETSQVEVARSENFESMKFGIQDIKTIMHIMRNKMYTNPIRTMMQEIMTNARDANIEGGNDNPIEVFLPTDENPVVIIKDTGLGMSKDLIRNIYVNYGSSTKRDTELQTGGYGLGAKSPFAYQDMFHITTTVNENGQNVQYKYCAFIGQDGIGDLNLIESEITTNPTGTSITIPVEPQDFSKIIDYATELPKYWNILPRLFLNGDAVSVDSKPEPENVVGNVSFYTKPTYGNVNHSILVDKIHYNINIGRLFSGESAESIADKYEIPDNIAFRIKNLLTNSSQNMMFDFNNGDIELSPNREEILYNDKNKKKLFWTIANVVEKIFNDIQVEIESRSSYLSALVLVYHEKNYHNLNWLFQKDLCYNGIKLKKKISCPLNHDVKAVEYCHSYGNTWSRTKIDRLYFNVPIYVQRDITKRFLSQMEELKKSGSSFVVVKRANPPKVMEIAVNANPQPKVYTFDDWMKENEFWLNEVGFKYLDDVVVSEKERVKTTRSLPTLDVYCWKRKQIISDVKIEDETPIYVRKCNDLYLLWDKEFTKNDFPYIARFFSIRFKKDIVILKKSITKKYDTSNWTLLDDLIIPECEKIVNSKYFGFHVANAERNFNASNHIFNPHVYKNDPIMQKIFKLDSMKYNGRRIDVIKSIFKMVDFKYEIDKDMYIDISKYIYEMYPHVMGVHCIVQHYKQIRQGRVIPKTNFFQNKNLKRRRHYV